MTEDDQEEEDDDEEEDEEDVEDEPVVLSGSPVKKLAVAAPAPRVEPRRGPDVPALRISRSELTMQLRFAGEEDEEEDKYANRERNSADVGSQSMRSRSRSRSGLQDAGGGGVGSRKHPLVRSLSMRSRRPSELVVTDTDFSGAGHSWLSPRQQVVSPRKEKVSPRKWKPWQSTPRGTGDAAVQGWVVVLSSSLKWKKMFGVVEEGYLKLYKREWSGGAGGTPRRRVGLADSVVRADADKMVAGRRFVVEVSSREGPVVMCLESRGEVKRWGAALRAEAGKSGGPTAFPGIRMHEVVEEEPDETWRALAEEDEGWRVELSTTPVDVTFGGGVGGAGRGHVDRLFQEPSSAWVGVERGEVFLALVAHADDLSRLLVRTGRQDRLVECLPVRQDGRLLKLLETSQVHQVGAAQRERLAELDSIGAQDMAEFQRFKFGVVRGIQCPEKELWADQQRMTADLEEFLEALGERVALRGYDGYAGGLDTSASASDGEHVLVTEKEGRSVAFHVGPWIPPGRRKRHIANDYCVVVFLDDGRPFQPSQIRTKLTHMYLVVQKARGPSLATGKTLYRVACVMREGMPTVGPRLLRSPLYEKNAAFVDFLITKLLNGERGARFAPDFLKQRAELRTWWLEQLLNDCEKLK